MTEDAANPGPKARSAARLAAVQALYQAAIGGQSAADIIAEFAAHRLGAEIDGAQYAEADASHFEAVVRGVVAGETAIDGLIAEATEQGWGAGRLEITLRAILRAAAYEFMERPDVPARVVIAEYVDLARSFFSDPGKAAFVNGILDSWARQLRGGEFAEPAARAAVK
jgi:N utilization substance protein B